MACWDLYLLLQLLTAVPAAPQRRLALVAALYVLCWGVALADRLHALQAGAGGRSQVGLGRMAALCHSPSTSYQIHWHSRCLFF